MFFRYAELLNQGLVSIKRDPELSYVYCVMFFNGQVNYIDECSANFLMKNSSLPDMEAWDYFAQLEKAMESFK